MFGLVVGSFVGVVSYRIPKGLGFIKGRSFCDSCKKELSWYDNIPILSYLRYKGRSRCCNKKISIRYLLIELASAIGIISLSPIYYLLYILCLTIFVIDLENQIIPDELIWLIVLLFLITSPYPLFPNIFAGFFFALIILLIHLVTKGRGMGLGDVKLTLGLGFWLGLTKGFIFLFLAFLIGGIVAFLLLILKKANLKTKIAFGPFLIIGFLITLLFI